MNRVLHNTYTKMFCLLVGVDVAYFCLINPSVSKSGVLFVGFLLVVLTIFVASEGVLRVCRSLFEHPKQRIHRLAAATTAIIGVLIALQSIGQLSSRDAAVVISVAVLVYVYSTYFSAERKS